MMFETYLKWWQAHERAVLIVAVLAFGIYGWNKWLTKSAHDADVAASVDKQAAILAKQAADQQAALLQQQIAQFNAQEAQREQEMTTLMAAVASRDAAAASKITTVEAPKTPSQAVSDLSTVYTLPVPVATTATGASVPTADLQLFTATKIQGDTCEADLTDTKTELAASQASVTQATQVIADFQKTTADLNSEIKSTAVANAAEVKQLKADARKSKLHWFLTGVLVGLGIRTVK
jgi:hypothetical protein